MFKVFKQIKEVFIFSYILINSIIVSVILLFLFSVISSKGAGRFVENLFESITAILLYPV